jgi:hypothetical protein
MALSGIAGVVSGLTPIGISPGGPILITGEPRREYLFQFLLQPPKVLPSSWQTILFSRLALIYISGLAEKVSLPPDKFVMGQVNVGTLQMPFPQHFEIASLSVTYMEDELGLVTLFHRKWMEHIRGRESMGDSGASVPGGGLVFEELGKVCARALYAPSKRIPLGFVSMEIPIPTGVEVFPRVFPVQIDKDPPNRSGNNLSKVTITYARVPRISMPPNMSVHQFYPRSKPMAPDSAYSGGRFD